MAEPRIQIRRSSVPGKIPTEAQLSPGEFAINTYDGKVYIEQDQGGVGVGTTVIVVNPWSVGTGTNTYNTYFTSGNIGIGTTNPTSKLQVIGNANISGVVTANAFVGDGSGLTGIIAAGSGVVIQDNGSTVGTANTIDFGSNLSVTFSSGIATITGTGGGGASAGFTKNVTYYTATEGQTTFSANYNPGYVDVFLNGIKLSQSQYTATSGTSIVLNEGASLNDAVEIIALTEVIGIGIATAGGTVGSGVTIITFKGSGISTVTVASGIATVNIEGGGSSSSSNYAATAGIATYAITAGIATYATTSGVSTSVIGGIGSVTQLSVLGISTFTDGPVFVGSGTSTGTASQRLQVTGGAYVSGSVGIGTTNPLYPLHVLGNVLVAAGTSTGQHIVQKAYELNSGTLSWEGTAGQLFSITNNLTTGSIFSVNDISGIPSIDVNANGSVQLAPFGDNVGVGTTNPTSKLHVIGNSLFVGVVTASSFVGPLTGTATTATNLSDAANITTGTINSARLSGTYNINVSYATTAGIATYATTSGIATYATTAGVSTSVSGGTGSITQLQVTGISTFTNGPILIGSGTSTGTALQRLQVTGGAYVSGSVGIGTTNPTSSLDVVGEITARRVNSTQEGGQINFTRASDDTNAYAIDVYNDVGVAPKLRFLDTAASAERMSIDKSGNLLIGAGTSTGTTSQPLQVTGGTYISGSVGIGTTNPVTKLDVIGSQSGNITAVSALDIDCSTSNYFTKTISGVSTFTFSNPPSNRVYGFTMELTHTNGAVTWPTTVKWQNDTTPSLTTSRTHLFMFVTDDGGTRWRGSSLINYVN